MPYDARLDDAIGLIESRRRADDRWAANRTYAGAIHVTPQKPGHPSRWITLIATKVLHAYTAQ